MLKIKNVRMVPHPQDLRRRTGMDLICSICEINSSPSPTRPDGLVVGLRRVLLRKVNT